MKSLRMAATALVLVMPGIAMAATDGAPGATTSTGSFSTSVVVTGPAVPQVEIVGLEDRTMTPIIVDANNQIVSGGNYSSSGVEAYACLNGAPGGQMTITLTQTNLPSGLSGFHFISTTDRDANGQLDSIPAVSSYYNPTPLSLNGQINPGVPKAVFGTDAGCTAANKASYYGLGSGAIGFRPNSSLGNVALPGSYLAQVTVILAKN